MSGPVNDLMAKDLEAAVQSGDKSSIYTLALVGHLANLVEAVRALKPVHNEPAVWKTNPSAMSWQLRDVIEQRNTLQTEVDRLRAEMKERSDIAHARGFREHAILIQPEIDKLRAEIERLQAKVADDALTIGALKDENGWLKAGSDALDEDEALCWFCSNESTSGFCGRATCINALALRMNELKRFREREPEVQWAISLALPYASNSKHKARLDALRGFKVTNG